MYIIMKKTLLLFAGITLFISCKSGQNQSSKNSSELNELVSVSVFDKVLLPTPLNPETINKNGFKLFLGLYMPGKFFLII